MTTTTREIPTEIPAEAPSFTSNLKEVVGELRHLLWDGRTNYLVIRDYPDPKGGVKKGLFTVRSKDQIKESDQVVSQVKVVGDGLMLSLDNMVYIEGGQPVGATLISGNVSVDSRDGLKTAPMTEHLEDGYINVWGKVQPDEFLVTSYDFDGIDFDEVATVAELLAGTDLVFPGKYLFILAMLIVFLDVLGIINVL